MVLGEGARFLVRRGMAEQRSVEQMLDILDRARALGLTHITDNIREQPSFLCNCCRCCCELLAGVQMGFHDGIAKTPFLAEVDPERCDYCGACLRACNAKCIGLAEWRASPAQGPALGAGRHRGLPRLRRLPAGLRAAH
jgi:Na+-translocating ferredoxin:NAD+ oxidoreductase RNF subunit RnfB